MMTTNPFPVGSKVSFLPSPRTTKRAEGTVHDIVTTGEGRGRSTFLVVNCTDDVQRKIRPGAARAA